MFDPYEDPEEEDFPEAGRKPTINPMEHAKDTSEVPVAYHDPQPVVDVKGNHPEAEWASAMEPDVHESDPDVTTPVPTATKEDEKITKANAGFFGGKLHMPHFRHPHLPGHHTQVDEATQTSNEAGKSAPADYRAVPSDIDRGHSESASQEGHAKEGLLAGLRRRSSEIVHRMQPEHAKPKNELTGVWPEHHGDTTLENPQGR